MDSKQKKNFLILHTFWKDNKPTKSTKQLGFRFQLNVHIPKQCCDATKLNGQYNDNNICSLSSIMAFIVLKLEPRQQVHKVQGVVWGPNHNVIVIIADKIYACTNLICLFLLFYLWFCLSFLYIVFFLNFYLLIYILIIFYSFVDRLSYCL